MEAHLWALACISVLTCLLYPVVADHRTKLVVKVPHLIKHVHLNHIKPIHIYTKHSKKVDHHYNEGKDWDFNHKEIREKHKERGSFSNIIPIIWHHDTHSEALNEQQNKLELKKYYKKGLGDSTKNNHEQFNTPSTYDNDQRILPSNNIQSELRETGKKKDINNGKLQRYEKVPLETKKTNGFSKGFRQGKTKNTNSKSKTIDESGWQPVINDDETQFQQHRGGQHFNLKEHKSQYNSGENVHQNKSYADINDKNTKDVNGNNQKDSSKGVWSKQYMQVNEKGNRFMSHVSQGQLAHQISQPYPGEDFESLGDFNRHEYLKQIQPTNLHATPTWFQQSSTQQSQHHPQTHYLKSKAVSQHQVHLKAYTDQEQRWRLQKQNLQPQLYQQTHKYELFEQSNPQQQQKIQQQTYQQQNHQQYVRQQPLHHSTLAHPETQPHSPKMIMSEHKFQTPQHSMWLVQQHSVLPAPGQGHTTSHKQHKPLLFQKPVLSSPPLLVSKLPNQVLQDNTRGHEVNHQHRKVKQQWHQSVETSGVDGPASSYKVEVINYSPIENVHPLATK